MTTTAQQRNVIGGNEFASLGSRLVRFGQALQEPDTKVGELMQLAQACGINFKLRAVAESTEGGGYVSDA